jgi:dipeptidyl aminopeptidase/acylaminoacyl peptidase
MHDLREVFEMVTKQTEPDLDSWKQQQDRQRRRARDRKLGAIGLVAALVVGLVVFALTRPPGGNDMPAKSVSVTPSVPFNTTPPIGPQIVRTDGTPITQLLDALWSGQSVRLSPDGTAIAYIAADGSVHTVGIDGTGDRALTDASNSNTGDAQNHVEWSVDGTHLVYAYSGNIYTMKANGTEQQAITHAKGGVGYYYPTVKPTGHDIAFWGGSSTGQDGGPSNADIYTMPAIEGANPTQLTNDGARNIEPAWSPDGKQIVFKHGDALGIMRSDGSHLHDLTSLRYGPWAPAWSPDGGSVAYLHCCVETGTPPHLDVQVIDLKTRQVHHVHADVTTDMNGPQWLLDGELLVNRYH